MSQLAQRLLMAAGGGKKTSTYIEDVFSTQLYKGNQTSRTIDNGIKLSKPMSDAPYPTQLYF